ncbi:hypothetical protein EW145_g2213 [Phellinidium pouzarii]|uniref:Uncharacterized protein n=1 Tax=Phellinidium pouzarii TaxID=167371 RepID=A0A4S4LBQ2_9AGAM|nr:hypothetical protein EW145_g2213 [Phellinidium pouzarii]
MDTESTHSPPIPPLAERFEDETDTSSLSDYDSEWTQISGTEDDSDFPPLVATTGRRPSSRAETIDGSVDGDIWEGFADGIHLCTSEPSEDVHSQDDSDATHERDAQSLSASFATTDEDDRINDALNCSVIGTLRASRVRSVASSLHTSLTDTQSKLRLSFPDPLVSSRNELDSDAVQQGALTPTSSTDGHFENFTEEASSSFADVEAPILDVSGPADEDASVHSFPVIASCILSLVLYGSAALSKWHIAEKIMSLALQYDGKAHLLVEEGTTRCYYFDSRVSVGGPFARASERYVFVQVVDRTSSNFEMAFTDVCDEAPSLAVILLPSRLPADLPKHTYYLPLISPPSLDFGTTVPAISSSFSEQVMSDSAQYAWERLEIPNECLVTLDNERPGAILDVTTLESLDRTTLINTLSVLFNPKKEAQTDRVYETERFGNRWYTIAFVAATILAITVGGFSLSSKSATRIASTNGTIQADNMTLSVSSVSSGDVVSINTKHHALAVFHSPSNSLATVTTKIVLQTNTASISGISACVVADAVKESGDVISSTMSTTSSFSACNCHPSPSSSSWGDRITFGMSGYKAKDLIIRPTAALRVFRKERFLLSSLLAASPVEHKDSRLIKDDTKDKGKGKAVSMRAVDDSLALISSMSKALVRVAGKDLHQVYEAIDELLGALSRQMEGAKAGMKAVKSLARGELMFRNARAKESAKNIRRAGERLFKAAGECMRSGTEEAAKIVSNAREGARKVQEEAVKSRLARRTRRRKASEKAKDEHLGAKGRRGTGTSDEGQKRMTKGQRRLRRGEVNNEILRRDEEESGGILEAVLGAVF